MRRLALCAILAGCLGQSVRADSGYDLIFRSGTLEGFAAGDALDYQSDLSITGPAAEKLDQSLVLSMAPTGTVVLKERGDSRELAEFETVAGNPIGMYFLETTVRKIAETTGGSPFYVRNRLKDAVVSPESISDVSVEWHGISTAAQQVTLAPFVGDAHGTELGDFADLRIEVTVSDNIPGWYHSLTAQTPEHADGQRLYSATLVLTGDDR